VTPRTRLIARLGAIAEPETGFHTAFEYEYRCAEYEYRCAECEYRCAEQDMMAASTRDLDQNNRLPWSGGTGRGRMASQPPPPSEPCPLNLSPDSVVELMPSMAWQFHSQLAVDIEVTADAQR
jgi:hypothetical protein